MADGAPLVARVTDPPLAELDKLPTPLNDGERMVLEFFHRHLPPAWEIYIQPHLNGLRPDFVLLHPNVGIAVFEVKHWNLGARRLDWELRPNLPPKLISADQNGRRYVVTDDPVAKVETYRERIATLFCPSLAVGRATERQRVAVVTAGIILTGCGTLEARALLEPGRDYYKMLQPARAPYYPVAGADALRNGWLGDVFPDALRYSSLHMNPTLAAELRSWLQEPEAARLQRQPLGLDARQRELANQRTPTGYRRIRGAAGSGKSVVIAARACVLAAEGKRVLVVGFNITLGNWLRDLAKRHQLQGPNFNKTIQWIHFHGLLRDTCHAAGLQPEWAKLVSSDRKLDNSALCQLTHTALNILLDPGRDDGDDPLGDVRYDAVLVDEGQDFEPEWWRLLRRFLRPGGEMLAVADRAQDIYKRGAEPTETAMVGAGFSGPWMTLERSYRLAPELAALARTYQAAYDIVDKDAPLVSHESLLPGWSNLRWVQLANAEDLAAQCAREAMRLPEVGRDNHVTWSDVTFLTEDHVIGNKIVEFLLRRGIQCLHIFSDNPKSSRLSKFGFFSGDPRVKGCTIQSFKGWEARAIVLCIDAEAASQAALYYVGLTRLRFSDRPCYLTVVCADPELEWFGRQWPEFVEQPTADPPTAAPTPPATNT